MSDLLDKKDKTIGVVDEPNPGTNDDTLSIDRHADALTEYIKYCDTPMTIGIQGEWGSGKTSLLFSIKEAIGQEDFAQIWINSWEHSLLVTPEEALLKIINHIINEMIAQSGKKRDENLREAAKGIMKGALRVGASMTLGGKGSEVIEEFLDEDSNAIKKLREQLEELSQAITQHNKKKIIVYVDDLDRIEPRNAVQILELLKNIFSIPHCVFILAIDYQVVVKGLEHKFGKRTEENEWEFRAFFDKIINLPFMMPMGQYDIGEYVIDLLKKIGYLDGGEDYKEEITTIIINSIGGNPRSLKRLVNSLALIDIFKNLGKMDEDSDDKKNTGDDEEEESNPETEDNYAKQLKDGQRKDLLMFSLVCLQISYPEVYDLLGIEHDFTKWNDDFAARVTQKKEEGIEKVEKEKFNIQFELAKKKDEFNDEWEQALYRICYLKPRYRSHVNEISTLLNFINDEILEGITGEDLEKFIGDVIKETSVTSVKTTDSTQQIPERKPFERQIFEKADEGLPFYFDHQKLDQPHHKKIRELVEHIDKDMRGKFGEEYKFQYSKSMGATIYAKNKQSKIGQISIFPMRKSFVFDDGKSIGYDIPRNTYVEIQLWRSINHEWKKPKINEKIFGRNTRQPWDTDIKSYSILFDSNNDYDEVKEKIYDLLELSKKTYEEKEKWKKKGQKPGAKYAQILFKNGQGFNKTTGNYRSKNFERYISEEWLYDVE
jgi:hypothetical protein